MSPELVMYLCRMNSLVAQMEAMKVDNAARAVNNENPTWSSDCFNGLSGDFEALASCAGACLS